MWTITDEQIKNIETSRLAEREYRAFRILSKEPEFAVLQTDELKEKIHIFAGKVADHKMQETVLIEFIKQCVQKPAILDEMSVEQLVNKILSTT